ncbi:MAG: alanine racemase, partial [Actinobacteria bacterium]|nr:alanine racemase [Actinomycetota bacterium]
MDTTTAASTTRIVSGGNPSRYARTEPPGTRPTWAQIDLDAIAGNVAALKAQAAAPALMAVVKADGYGHGAVPAARAALAGGAEWLAVALVEEGEELRAAAIGAPTLLLTEPPPAHAVRVLAAELTPTIYTPAFTDALDAAAQDAGAGPLPVHLKLDTGMRRVGVPQADWEDALRRVRNAEGLRLGAIWSHFAVADEPHHPFIAHQAQEFARALELARSIGADYELAHLCNSAGTLHLHDHHYDMVRPGLAVYGLEPAPGLAGDTTLTPALSWWTRLSMVKHLAAGEAVSYGLRWTAARDTVLGTVPAGYADGVTRALGVGAGVGGGRHLLPLERLHPHPGEPDLAGVDLATLAPAPPAEVEPHRPGQLGPAGLGHDRLLGRVGDLRGADGEQAEGRGVARREGVGGDVAHARRLEGVFLGGASAGVLAGGPEGPGHGRDHGIGQAPLGLGLVHQP